MVVPETYDPDYEPNAFERASDDFSGPLPIGEVRDVQKYYLIFFMLVSLLPVCVYVCVCVCVCVCEHVQCMQVCAVCTHLHAVRKGGSCICMHEPPFLTVTMDYVHFKP